LVEVPVPFGYFVFEDQVVAKQIPGQLTDFAMVLMGIVAPMGEDHVRIDLGSQTLEPGLYLTALVGEEAVLEPAELDPAARRAGKERVGRGCGFLGARADRTQHAPVHLEPESRCDPLEDGAAGADLDVVGMRTETQHRQPRVRLREAQCSHIEAMDKALACLAPSLARQGIRPCSIISSSTWRSLRLSMQRQKPSCL